MCEMEYAMSKQNKCIREVYMCFLLFKRQLTSGDDDRCVRI